MKKFLMIFSLILIAFHLNAVNAATLKCDNMLQYNSVGNNVKLLQQKLNRTMGCNLEIDGIFGPLTQACVIDFQRQYGIETDGIAGPITCSKLNSVYNSTLKMNYVVVTGEVVNLRSGPSLNPSTVIETVKRGDILRVVGTKTVDGITWYRVYTKINSNNNRYGYAYIHSGYAKRSVILLDISKQKLTYYYDGKVYMNVNVVTGTKGISDTPVGTYVLNPQNKSMNKRVKGPNADGSRYILNANYWMPFILNNSIAFRDAYWREDSEYNANTYITNGTDGSVDMRYVDAFKLYKKVTVNTYVVVK